MKKYCSFGFFIACMLMLSSCVSARQDTTQTGVSAGPIILQFYSIGTGTPNDQPLLDYITSYRKKNKLPALSATLYGGLGREGEHSYVLPLKELTASQRKKFVSSLSKALPTLKSPTENGGINLVENQTFEAKNARVEPKTMTL